MIDDLLTAIKNDDQETVQKLITEGQPIDEANQTGMFPLLKAVANNKLSIARYLLEHGANLLLAHPDGSTPIVSACLRGTPELVQLLVDYHAPTRHSVRLGASRGTPLSIALGRKDLKMVSILLTQPFDPLDELYRPHFIYLSKNRCFAFFEVLVNCPDLKTREPTILSTTLLTAAHCNDIRLIDFLLDHGVDINVQHPENEQTALFTACAHGQLEAVKHLHTKGADIELANNQRFTPLMVCLSNSHIAIVDFLLNKRANVNAVSLQNLTPLSLLEQADRQAAEMLTELNECQSGPAMTLNEYHTNLGLLVRRILDLGGKFNYLAQFDYADTPAQQLIKAARMLNYRGIDIDDIHSHLEAYIAEKVLILGEDNVAQHVDDYLKQYLGPNQQELLPYVCLRLESIGECLDRVHHMEMFMNSAGAKRLNDDTRFLIFKYLEPEHRLESCPLQPMPKQDGIFFEYQLHADRKKFLNTLKRPDVVTRAAQRLQNLNLAC